RGDEIFGTGEAAGGTGDDGAVADRVFQAARRADDVGRAVGIYRDVAEVAGTAKMAAEKPTVTEDRAADARAKREEDGVLNGWRRYGRDARATEGTAEPQFAEQGRVGVVEHGDQARRVEERRPIEPRELIEAAPHPCDRAAIRG